MFPAMVFLRYNNLQAVYGCLRYLLYLLLIFSSFLEPSDGFILKLNSDIRNHRFVSVLSVTMNHDL